MPGMDTSSLTALDLNGSSIKNIPRVMKEVHNKRARCVSSYRTNPEQCRIGDPNTDQYGDRTHASTTQPCN